MDGHLISGNYLLASIEDTPPQKKSFTPPEDELLISPPKSSKNERVDSEPKGDRVDPECPFCTNARCWPSAVAFRQRCETLHKAIPTEPVDIHKAAPDYPCFIVVADRHVLAFLDLMPASDYHLLVTTRAHIKKAGDVPPREARDLGFWLPILAKAVERCSGRTDYNIVQNNGHGAAQVVDHVHFHIIPRPMNIASDPATRSRLMFGRHRRHDLLDEDGALHAARLRNAAREELEKAMKTHSYL